MIFYMNSCRLTSTLISLKLRIPIIHCFNIYKYAATTNPVNCLQSAVWSPCRPTVQCTAKSLLILCPYEIPASTFQYFQLQLQWVTRRSGMVITSRFSTGLSPTWYGRSGLVLTRSSVEVSWEGEQQGLVGTVWLDTPSACRHVKNE